MLSFSNAAGEGWLQLGELALALVLSALVGAEREIRQKSAGLRTHTLVGVSAALIMLISKYGFMDILATGRVVLDPSRVAAQVVSGIGFIGGGVIFMRRDVVRGLTTAASIWFTAALGMACGAGLPVLAVATTAAHFVIMLVFPQVARWLPRPRRTTADIRVSYQGGHGLLRRILLTCSELHFTINQVRLGNLNHVSEETQDLADWEGVAPERRRNGLVTVDMRVKGKRPATELIVALTSIDGVHEASTTEEETSELD